MKIDGTLIAKNIELHLSEKILQLKKNKIFPHLAIIMIGDDAPSLRYIHRKELVGQRLGVKVTAIIKEQKFSKSDLYSLVDRLNKDPDIYGIIIQRPVAADNIEKEELDRIVTAAKDVDAFHPDTKLFPPIGLAIMNILEFVYKQNYSRNIPDSGYINWLKTKNILVIGRGETGGKPVMKTLTRLNIPYKNANSKTENLKNTVKASDIIISCVGKPNIVRHDMLRKEHILIGVGLHMENSRLETDYNQEEISKKVAFYTPVPGGVGPVNVISLFQNLVTLIGDR